MQDQVMNGVLHFLAKTHRACDGRDDPAYASCNFKGLVNVAWREGSACSNQGKVHLCHRAACLKYFPCRSCLGLYNALAGTPASEATIAFRGLRYLDLTNDRVNFLTGAL